MSETFSVGEIALFVRPESARSGAEVLVTGALAIRRHVDAKDGTISVGPCYVIECAEWGIPDTGAWAVPPEYLRKKRPPPPREQTSTWDDLIVWRPKETVHV